MNRYIKSNKAESKVGNIWLLVYCDNVDDCHPTEIMSSEDDYTDDQEDLDIMYQSYSDEELSKLSTEEIQKIQNLSLIQRIGQLGKFMYRQLSQSQKSAYVEYAKNHHWLNKSDIPEVVSKIKNCTQIDALYSRTKNNNFRQKYSLSSKDLLDIVHCIEPSDFDESTSQLSFHGDYYGDQILVFTITGIELPSGVTLVSIKIYIKIDYSKSSNSSIAYFSIHEWKE